MTELLYKKNFRVAILAILDLVSVTLGVFGALILRFDIFNIPEQYFHNAVVSLPVYYLITLVILFSFRLYYRVWTYASLSDFIQIIKASIVIEVLIVCYHLFSAIIMPRTYYAIELVLLCSFLTLERFSIVIFRTIKRNRGREKKTKFAMVVGAGDAATIVIKEFNQSEGPIKIVCAVDDNINKKNKYILGVPIIGNRYDIEKNIKKYNISEIIIAMPSVEPKEIMEIVNICQDTGKTIKMLPSITKTLSSSVTKELRPISYEDLLGRDPISIDQEGIEALISGKVVMVTGGGGSIGSELCRQIITYNPEKLIIFDIYENNAYDIQMELERHYPKANISTLIGSIRDRHRLEKVFQKYSPDIIYHAAAHKHVPLMEKSPNEAIKNNCLGTLNLAQLAIEYGVKNFVLISTDKAVRPTNIMGATKRICEMIIQTYAKKSNYTTFAAVRFGNVLGSNGSVIPLFLKQIEEGGPVTVTHKDIMRFFMTIPEAVSLVLQAGLYAKGGEIFVLDMGKPVKIYDLALNLIKMKGYKPFEDIDIEIVGLRPGEKLYEEILMDEEGLDKTENNMIYIGKPINIKEDVFLDNLNNLIEEAFKDGYRIKEMAEEVCGTYTITDNDK